MDHEYELEDDYAPRVLWGRIAFFLLAVVLAFLGGRCTKSSGADPDEFAAQRQQIADLTERNELLEAQLSASATEAPPNNGSGKKRNQPTEPTDDPVGEGQKYTVVPNDTLTTIAQKFYGDPRKFDLIVDANNLDSTTDLRVGQELIIPPED